jgi:hypothetical protein
MALEKRPIRAARSSTRATVAAGAGGPSPGASPGKPSRAVLGEPPSSWRKLSRAFEPVAPVFLGAGMVLSRNGSTRAHFREVVRSFSSLSGSPWSATLCM